jgi:hypothetical protein
MNWNATPTAVGAVGGRLRTTAASVRIAVFSAALWGCLGSVFVPWAVTVPWLIAFCCVVFVAALTRWLRSDARSVTRVELNLEREPRDVVLRGPWRSRTYGLDAVAAIQTWCDCVPSVYPELDPHLDGLEIVLRNGRTVQVDTGTSIGPEVVLAWREWLEPLGVRVVDWRTG